MLADYSEEQGRVGEGPEKGALGPVLREEHNFEPPRTDEGSWYHTLHSAITCGLHGQVNIHFHQLDTITTLEVYNWQKVLTPLPTTLRWSEMDRAVTTKGRWKEKTGKKRAEGHTKVQSQKTLN